MKRMLALLLTLTLALGLLAGCGTTVVVAVPAPTPEAETPTPSPETPPATVPGGVPVKTGLALLTSVSSSKDATADADGLAQADITVVAVTVGDDGIIYDCVIDSIQSKLNFDTSGALLSDLTLTIPPKTSWAPTMVWGRSAPSAGSGTSRPSPWRTMWLARPSLR